MNLNFLIEKNHIFKRRKKRVFIYEHGFILPHGIYSLSQFRFEFIYLKVFKKIFRKKYVKKEKKRKTLKRKKRYWLMVKPNFLLTMKSKNSRMGSGVGLYVRVVSIVKPNKPLILLKRYSLFFVRNVVKYLKLKMNINSYISHKRLYVKIV